MLLLASAGSGKSTTLQIKFIESVNKWTLGKSIPIYFNLANETEINKIIE